MNAAAPKPPAPPAAGQALQLFPGVSFYQVLEASKVLGPNGDPTFAMVGPFADLAGASQYAATRPGSLITVTLVLHQAGAVPPAATPFKQP